MPQLRRRRIMGAVPVVLASWAVVGGLPVGSPAPGPGSLHTDTVVLTGSGATDTAPASGAARSRVRAAARRLPAWRAMDAGKHREWQHIVWKWS